MMGKSSKHAGIFSRYNPGPRRGAIDFGEEVTRTQQHMAADCDINNILNKYKRTGVLPTLIKKEPRFGDFADSPTYQESLELVMFSREQFEALPSAVRKRFRNEPAEFLAFASNPANSKEMAEMGLLTEEAKARILGQPGAPEPDPKKGAPPAPKASPKGKKSDDAED